MTKRKNLLIIAVILLLGIFTGFLLGGKFYETAKSSVKATARTTEFITEHTLCGHESTYTEQSKTQAEFSGEEEILNTFPEWELISLTDDKIVLKKKVANYCPDHFFAYLKNKKIHIETLNGDKKDILNVAAFSFTEEEEKTLTDGVYINGKEMYIAFIEDFTS